MHASCLALGPSRPLVRCIIVCGAWVRFDGGHALALARLTDAGADAGAETTDELFYRRWHGMMVSHRPHPRTLLACEIVTGTTTGSANLNVGGVNHPTDIDAELIDEPATARA